MSGQGRHLDILNIAGHRLDDDFVLQKVGADLGGIRRRFVDLVDRNDHRHLGCLGVVDRFDGLGHHGIIRRHDQNHDIGYMGTTRPHRGESSVYRCIQERQDRTLGS